jgi:hypothetical protein
MRNTIALSRKYLLISEAIKAIRSEKDKELCERFGVGDSSPSLK